MSLHITPITTCAAASAGNQVRGVNGSGAMVVTDVEEEAGGWGGKGADAVDVGLAPMEEADECAVLCTSKMCLSIH
eukprot:1675582-Ditylum_brightwellii.AAC.1